MNHPTRTELPLLSSTSTNDDGGGCCGGDSCGCGTPTGASTTTTATTQRTKEQQMNEQSTQTFAVTGMTCGHCAGAVTEEIQQLPGVTDVAVDLVAGGISTVKVTSTESIGDTLIAAALEEAGDYQLA